jgi:DNA-binding beta-propeller fold protein YncE
VTLDGGYFGTTNVIFDANTNKPVQGNSVVNVLFNGQSVPIFNALSPSSSNFTLVPDRQLKLTLDSSLVSGGPGLYPIAVVNNVSCPPSGMPVCGTGSPNGSIAAANLAVQPTSTPTQLGSPISVGTTPTSVAINTAMGIVVVTNQASHDITLISLATQLAVGSLCTDGTSGPCTPTGPVSVAVDNLRNLALVANNANATLAVVDISVPTAPILAAPLMRFASADPTNGNAVSLAPVAVGINPVTGRALVAFSSGASGSNVGAILDLTQSPPALINVVNINNGPKPHIAVSPKLNWALVTPGGAGSLSIVDLGRRTPNPISNITCSGNVATVTVNATVGLFVGQPVLISGANSSDNGIFSVRSVSNNSSFTYLQSSCTPSGRVGTASYAQPVASVGTDANLRGVSINDESQKALFANPTNTVPAFVFNILDQTSLAINLPPFPATSNVATAINPLTNIGLVVNQDGDVAVVNPVAPAVLFHFTWSTPIPTPALVVDAAIDPITNTAVIVSQAENKVRLLSLGALRSAPQIIQSSMTPVAPQSCQATQATICSSLLGSAATAQNQTVRLVGNFPGTPVPRIDGNCSSSAFVGLPTITNGGRMLTATILGSFLAANGPRLYALDVVDSCTTPTSFSNAAPLQVIQAVSLVTPSLVTPSDCSNPAPQGVAIDAAHNAVVVTEPGCNDVSIINLANGIGLGAKPELAVGINPQGVAVYPQAGLAVAANAGSNSVSIVDIVNDAVSTTFTTDPTPTGVAIDLGLGKAAVTANGASLVDVFPVSTTSQTPTSIGVQQGPTGVAINQTSHVALVANSSSNTASVVNLSSNTASFTSNPISFPQGVAFDPITGKFLITSLASNQVIVFDPNTGSTLSPPPIRVGIGPSSIAYNFASGTLVTANSLSGTVSVVDFIDQTVRGVFSLPSSTQFAIDIHPQTNLAVVADTADNEVLLVPLPH